MTAMNEQDKHAFLNEMRRGGEIYQAEVWGTVTADRKTQAMFSSLPSRMALADVYAYIGMSEENINIVAVNTQKPDVILGRMRLPFEKITSAEIHGAESFNVYHKPVFSLSGKAVFHGTGNF